MLTVIGIGMDGDSTLTAEGLWEIEDADYLIGSERAVQRFADKKKTYVEWSAEKIERIIRSEQGNGAYLVSGDVGFYSGAKQMQERLGKENVRFVAGISTPVYMCAKLGIPWERVKLISLHGNDAPVAVHCAVNEYVFAITSGGDAVKDIARRLIEYELPDLHIWVGEDLGYPTEQITEGSLQEIAEYERGFSHLCSVVIYNPVPGTAYSFGIPDDRFIRREGIPMTKAEIRAVVMSKLCISDDTPCLDIGSGSGSVSVELAKRACTVSVTAVDISEDAVRLTMENSRRFHCDNIKAVCMDAFEYIEKNSCPDHVFIGGSGRPGKLAELIHEKNPKAMIVATAVTPQTISQLCLPGTEITTVSVTRTKFVNGYHLPIPMSPVHIAVIHPEK